MYRVLLFLCSPRSSLIHIVLLVYVLFPTSFTFSAPFFSWKCSRETVEMCLPSSPIEIEQTFVNHDTHLSRARIIEIKSAKCGYSDLLVSVSATIASIRAKDLLFFDFTSPPTATRTILTGVISLTSPVQRGANSESSN